VEAQQMLLWQAPTIKADWNKAENKDQLLKHLLNDKIMRPTMDRAAKALNLKVGRGLTDYEVKLQLIEYLTCHEALKID
jgi:hypothetical protein